MSKARSPRALSSTTVGTNGPDRYVMEPPRSERPTSATDRLRTISVSGLAGVGNLMVAYDGAMRQEGVTRSVVLPAPPDEVWVMLTRPEELSAWLGEVVELELEPGGSLIVRED